MERIPIMMTATIRNAANGCILVVKDDEDGDKEVVYQAYSTDEDKGEEVECFADFLRFLNDTFGPTTSRYSSKRIHICVEPGDKWEGQS